eukprot:1394590-Rhodomonas_salina.2
MVATPAERASIREGRNSVEIPGPDRYHALFAVWKVTVCNCQCTVCGCEVTVCNRQVNVWFWSALF